MNDTLWNVLGSAIGALAGSIPALVYTVRHRNADIRVKKDDDSKRIEYAKVLIQTCLVRLSGIYTGLSKHTIFADVGGFKVPPALYLQSVNVAKETNKLLELSIGIVNETRDSELLSHVMAIKADLDQFLGLPEVYNPPDRTILKARATSLVEYIQGMQRIYDIYGISMKVTKE